MFNKGLLRERIKAKTAAKRAKMKEALDPVGKEDGDVNNDGKKDRKLILIC